MSSKLYPEDKERAKEVFNRMKGDAVDTISLFEAVTVLHELGIEADSDSLYKENKAWDINFERFCDIYGNKKEAQDLAELRKVVTEAFEALGGQSGMQGMIDNQKVIDVFKFFNFDISPDDYFAHGGYDINSNIVYDDFLTIHDLSTRQ